MILDKELLAKNIEKRAGSDLAENNISGAAVAVYQGGEEVYRGFFGATEPNGSTPITDKTVFRLASMTKPITAVAVLKELERGRLDLNDPVEKYFPDFSNMQVAIFDENRNIVATRPANTKPTILHMITHTAGLVSKSIRPIYDPMMTPEDDKDLASALKFYSKTALAFEPFTAQEYSGSASFDVVAAIVEKTSGMNFNEYLRKEICEPCGMVDTTFTPSEEQWARMITMHNKVDGKSVVGQTHKGCVFAKTPTTHYRAGAGLISTLSDYAKFADMLRRGGITAGGTRILKEETVKKMATPHVPESIQPKKQRWGLSVRVITETSYQHLPVGAYGWSGAYGTHFWIDPVNDVVGIYLKNSHYDGGSGAVTARHFEKDVNASFIR